MNCEQVKDLLLESFGERVQSEEIAEHLRGCPACREFAEELNELMTVAGTNEDFFPDPEVTESLIAGVETRIDRMESAKATPVHSIWRSYIPAVAALLVVVGFSVTAYMLNMFSSKHSAQVSPDSNASLLVIKDADVDSLSSGEVNFILNDYSADHSGTVSGDVYDNVSQEELEYLENNLKAGDIL